MRAAPRNVVIDSGVLAAAANHRDMRHEWALRALGAMRGRAVTCEAAVTEAVHLVKNSAGATLRLRDLLLRMEIIPFGAAGLAALFAEIVRYSPRMDFADACAVALQRNLAASFVLTLDDRDFKTYRVPFASPAGAFHH